MRLWLWLAISFLLVIAFLPERTAAQSEAAKKSHWAFQPIKRPALPDIKNKAWIRNPIDAFILGRLEQAKLEPSKEADRATLIRRLKFDVLGLPPTPKETDAFVKDADPQAYEKLVDKYLASPHFGERWARHWLDAVRFAESDGFETNQPRMNAWPYRDYVIRALNEDKPYDRFILEQLAGDQLGVDEATGFLVGGPYDKVKSPDINLTLMQRGDELHDMVNTTAATFLGLTVGCARCHDHKFDPISIKDYYGMRAVFAGVQHGERPIKKEADVARIKELRRQLADLEREIIAAEPLANPQAKEPQRMPVNALGNVERFAPVKAKFIRFTIEATNNLEPCLDELEIFAAGKNVALMAKATSSGNYPGAAIHKLEHVNDGKYGNSRSWISNTIGTGWVQLELPKAETVERIEWARDREGKYADRLAVKYRIEVTVEPLQWQVVASSVDRFAYGVKLPERMQARLLAKRADLEKQLRIAEGMTLAYAGKFTTPEETHRLHRGDPMQKREAIAPASVAFFGGKLVFLPSPLRGRGAGGEGAVPQEVGPFKSTDAERRLALAKWITDPQNPLTARVLVNRLWQHHFGVGIVETPSDFGLNGGKPSHPELIDWLASEFLPSPPRGRGAGGEGAFLPSPLRGRGAGGEGAAAPTNAMRNEERGMRNEEVTIGISTSQFLIPRSSFLIATTQPEKSTAKAWSMKHIHRLILLSATYRQASAANPTGRAADAGTRLLWRYPPRRLDAEPLRDAYLFVSGKLDLKMGGPGFDLFEPNTNYVKVYNPKKDFGPNEWRRMIYQSKWRMQLDDVFGAFDCPDAGQIAPKRTNSTTALQALNLLNSRFMLQQAKFFAERVEREAGNDIDKQIERGFRLAFQRTPTPTESTAASQLVRAHGLPAFCRALFNANEFVFVD